MTMSDDVSINALTAYHDSRNDSLLQSKSGAGRHGRRGCAWCWTLSVSASVTCYKSNSGNCQVKRKSSTLTRTTKTRALTREEIGQRIQRVVSGMESDKTAEVWRKQSTWEQSESELV